MCVLCSILLLANCDSILNIAWDQKIIYWGLKRAAQNFIGNSSKESQQEKITDSTRPREKPALALGKPVIRTFPHPPLREDCLENFLVNMLILDKSAVCAVQLDIVLNFTFGLLLHLLTKSLKIRRDLLLQRPKIVLKLILRKSESKPFRSLVTNVYTCFLCNFLVQNTY